LTHLRLIKEEEVAQSTMSKRMRRFILNSARAVLVLGTALAIFEQIGPNVTGDYFTLIWWGIVLLSLAVAAFIGWRLCVGIQSGHLLFDDMDE
jgi:hypothetical protein